MLKICDDVDLKELEKFGFKYSWKDNIYECYDFNKGDIYVDIKNEDKEYIRKIYTDNYDYEDENYYFDYKALGIIYDLIQAGLVEKVENK